MNITLPALTGAAYLLGSVPFGLVFSRLIAGRDPREVGSGNIGATNALRAGGRLVGGLTLAADVGKGAAAVGLARALGLDEFGMAVVALAAFLGHLFPVFLKFRGGKGVATMFGVLLPWMPWVAVLAFAIWLAALKVSRYVSLASMLAAASVPLGAFWVAESRAGLAAGVVVAVLVVVRHASNIRRLIDGTEPTTDEDRAARLRESR